MSNENENLENLQNHLNPGNGAQEDFTDKVERQQFENDDAEYKQSQMTDGVSLEDLTQSEKSYQDHELRVIEERNELAERTAKLRIFIAENPIFKTLPPVVQTLRQAQLFHMEQYEGILTEVIRLFSGGEEAPVSKGRDLIGDFGIGNESVFILKYISALMIDATDALGQDPRRNAVVATDMEKVQMMAVKSVFSKPKPRQ